MIDDEIDAAIARLIGQWNIAERRIKRAEFVKAGEVVSSAIYELRYAGRKLIDANEVLLSGTWKTSVADRTSILTFIADATEDCVKAKHDAIDSMMLFVAQWFRRTEEKIGLKEVLSYFPDYVEITGMISGVQDRIAENRGNRTTSRDSSYDQIEGDEYGKILSLFQRMRESEPRVHAEVARLRRKDGLLFWAAIVGPAIGLAALAASIVALFK